MKKLVLPFLPIAALILLFNFLSCKKESDDDTPPVNSGGNGGGGTSAYTEYIISNPNVNYTGNGEIVIQQEAFTLHPGMTGNINAMIRNEQGNLISGNFNFQSSDTSVAIVNSSGIITAVNEGEASISIDEPVFGNRAVTVQVVNSTTTISTDPVFIQFNPGFVLHDITAGPYTFNFTFTLSDIAGNMVAGNPIFVLAKGDPGRLQINGTSITNTGIGVFHVKGVINGDTLIGKMYVQGYQIGVPDPLCDTNFVIDHFYISKYPAKFSKRTLISQPVLVETYEYIPCPSSLVFNIVVSRTTTRVPDKLLVQNTKVVKANALGELIAVGPGRSEVVVVVDTLTRKFIAVVSTDLVGNYTVAFNNGKHGCFSILDQDWPSGIRYATQAFGAPTIGGTPSCGSVYGRGYLYDQNGAILCQPSSPTDKNMAATGDPLAQGYNPYASVNYCCFAPNAAGLMGYYQPDGSFAGNDGSITSGGGGSCGCVYDNYLTNGSTRTWNYQGSPAITFNINGTWSAGTSSGTWNNPSCSSQITIAIDPPDCSITITITATSLSYIDCDGIPVTLN